MTPKPASKKAPKRVPKTLSAKAPRKKRVVLSVILAEDPIAQLPGNERELVTTTPGVILAEEPVAEPAPAKPMEIFRRVPRLAVAVAARAPEGAREVRDTLKEILAHLTLDPSLSEGEVMRVERMRPGLRSPLLSVSRFRNAA